MEAREHSEQMEKLEKDKTELMEKTQVDKDFVMSVSNECTGRYE